MCLFLDSSWHSWHLHRLISNRIFIVSCNLYELPCAPETCIAFKSLYLTSESWGNGYSTFSNLIFLSWFVGKINSGDGELWKRTTLGKACQSELEWNCPAFQQGMHSWQEKGYVWISACEWNMKFMTKSCFCSNEPELNSHHHWYGLKNSNKKKPLSRLPSCLQHRPCCQCLEPFLNLPLENTKASLVHRT